MNKETLDLIVLYGPTLIFISDIALACIIGYFRGARKTGIMFLGSVITVFILFFTYLFTATNYAVDAFILNVTNQICGSKTYMQDLFGVSQSCASFREILIEYLPQNMNFFTGMSLLFEENVAYLNTLVDLVYRIGFALVFFVLYIIIMIIYNLVYLIFFNNIKAKKKQNIDYAYGLADTPFKKRRGLGLALNGFRHILTSLIGFSLIGSLLFIVSGDGTRKEASYDFGDENYNLIYNAYSSLGSYGTEGIFKILNACKDKDEIPYYLYVANIVLQGQLTDEDRYINQKVYFSDELKAYVEFSRDVFDLVLKYRQEDILAIMNGTYTEDYTNIVLELIEDQDFREEFNKIIYNFEAKTYFVNLTLSLVDTFVANIEEFGVSGISDDALAVLKILFKKGYYCEKIPYEAYLSTHEESYSLSTINATSIITRNDIYVVYDGFLEIYDYLYSEAYNEETAVTDIIDIVLPMAQDLSIFNGTRVDLNNALRRLYAFAYETYLSSDSVLIPEEDRVPTTFEYENDRYCNGQFDDIDPAKELKSISRVVSEVFTVYGNFNVEEEDVLTSILGMLDSSNENYQTNLAAVDAIIDTISNSNLCDSAIGSPFVRYFLETNLSSLISVTIPDNIEYANKVVDGKIVYGELASLLISIRSLATNEEGKALINKLMNESSSMTQEEMIASINQMAQFFGYIEPKTGLTNGELFTSSTLLRIILSSFVLNNSDLGDLSLYFDESILETPICITQEELLTFISIIPNLMNVLDEVSNVSDITNALDLLSNKDVIECLNSKVIEGTMTNFMLSSLESIDFIVVPKQVNYISTDRKKSEVRSLIDILSIDGFDLSKLVSGELDASEMGTEIMNSLSSLSENDLETIMNYKLILYSCSNFIDTNRDSLISGITLVIPDYLFDNLRQEKITRCIQSTALISLLSIVDSLLESASSLDANSIIKEIVNNDLVLENDIFLATMVNAFVNDDTIRSQMGDAIVVPKCLLNKDGKAPTSDMTKAQYIKWKSEMNSFIHGLDIILGITEDPDFDLSNIDFMSRISVTSLKNDVDEFYESKIISASISKILSDQLTDDLIDYSIKVSSFCYNSSYEAFKIDEIKALLLAFEVMNIDLDDMSSVTVESFENVLDQDNLLDSYIIRGIITKRIKSYIESNDSIDDCSKAYETNIALYKKCEINAILDIKGDQSFSSIDANAFTFETIKNAIGYDQTTGSVNSYLLLRTMTKNMEALDDVIIPTDVYNIYDGKKCFVPSEAIKLLDSLIILGATDINTIDFTTMLHIDTLKANIDTLYESRIVACSLSEQVYIQIFDMVDSTVVHHELIFDSEMECYKLSEVKAVLEGISAFGVDFDEMDQITLDNYEALTESRRDSLLDSYILRGIITKKISDVIKSNSSLDECYKAYEENIHIYRKCEIKTILDVKGDNSLSSFDLNTITFNTIKKAIGYNSLTGDVNSYLALQSMTKNLVDIPQVVIPEDILSVYHDKKIINPDEAIKLLDGLSKLSSSTIGDLEIADATIPSSKADVEKVCESMILRASISKSININFGSDSRTMVIHDDEYVYQTKSYTTNTIYVLTSSELMNLVEVLKIIDDSMKFKTNLLTIEKLTSLSESEQDTILKSSVFRSCISELLVTGFKVSGMTINYSTLFPTEVINEEEVVVLSTYYITVKKVLSNVQIKKFLTQYKIFAMTL